MVVEAVLSGGRSKSQSKVAKAHEKDRGSSMIGLNRATDTPRGVSSPCRTIFLVIVRVKLEKRCTNLHSLFIPAPVSEDLCINL